MEITSPQSIKNRSNQNLSSDRNPFPSFGSWSSASLSQIEICYPVLTGKNETTNELTQSTRPGARYRKALISFKFSSFTSETMRFDNVHIPFHTGKGYGSKSVYICLPGHAGKAFSDAGKTIAPTRVTETSLIPDRQRWWKKANDVKQFFGVINHEIKKFHKKSLETIFDATQSGVSCSVTLKFNCKAFTTEMEPLRPTTARTVAVEVIRGFISQVDINIQMPTRVSREKAKIEPVATCAYVATDHLMERLGELGL